MKAQPVRVPINFSAHANQVLDYAIERAQKLQTRFTLPHVFHLTPLMIGDGLTSTLEADLYEMETEAQQQIPALLGRVHQAGLPGDGATVQGIPFQAIVDMAGNKDDDLIVMRTHGRTVLRHVLIGSVAEKVVRLALYPVRVTQGTTEVPHA